jgi:selenocysteine lyase/cysteine desulfurase
MQMGVENMMQREEELLKIALPGLREIEGIQILANNVDERLGVISFYHPDIHFNLFVKLLNDRFGIQTRGGCACAGTYGHFLLEVSYDQSQEITDKINHGDLSEKPGWVRWSLHPTMTDQEVLFILDAIRQVSIHHREWGKDYVYLSKKNEFIHQSHQEQLPEESITKDWFKF